MRESRGRYSAITFGVACLVAGWLFTGSAVASTHTSFTVSAPAAQGYRFSLFGEVKPGSARPAAAGFGTRNDSVFTFYSARHAVRATRSRIHARLPGLGRVNVRFDERRRKNSTIGIGHGCRLVTVRRIGVFRGDLDMQGDGGYAGVDRNRASGEYERSGFKGCGGGHFRPAVPRSAARPQSGPEAVLASCGPGPGVAFAGFASLRASGFVASSSERDRGLWILRYVSAEGKGRAMRFSPQLKRARVIPPGPYFDGSARFASGALRGDLTASFIGADDVPLTPGDARLRSADIDHVPRCLPLLLGSSALPGAPIPGLRAPLPAGDLANLVPALGPGLPAR